MTPYLLGQAYRFSVANIASAATGLFFNPKNPKIELEKQLKEQTGSSAFAATLIKCTPKIQKQLTDLLGCHFNTEDIDTLLLQVASNAFTKIPLHPGVDPVVSLADHVAQIISTINVSPDSVENVVHKLLDLFFPNGADDLPINTAIARNFAWGKIKTALVDYAKECHAEFSQVSSAPYERTLGEMGEQGAAFLQECQGHAKKITYEIPKTIFDKSRGIAAQITGDPSEQEWLTNCIQRLVGSNIQSLLPIWSFLEKQIEPLVIHILGHLTRCGEKGISDQIVALFNQAIEKNPSANFEKWAQNTVEVLFQEIGLSKEESLPMAKKLRSILYPLVKETLFTHLAKIYESLDKTVIANAKKGQQLRNVVGERAAAEITGVVCTFSRNIQMQFLGFEEVAAVRKIAEGTVQSTLLAICTNLFGRVSTVDSPGILSTTAISIMELVGNHFQLIGQIREKEKKTYTHHVSYGAYTREFGPYLTNGVPKSDQSLAARRRIRTLQYEIKQVEKWIRFSFLSSTTASLQATLAGKKQELATHQEILDKERVDGFFIPLVKDLLEIAGITKEFLPSSSKAMQDSLWDSLTTEILPKLLCNVYNKLLTPSTMHALFLSFVETMQTSIQTAATDSSDDSVIYNDPRQREMNEALGNLILKGIETIPGTLAESMLSIRTLRKMTAASIGNKFRKQLETNTSMAKIVQDALVKGLSMPLTKGEEVDAAQTKNKLHKALVDMIINQSLEAFKAKLISPWDVLHDIIEAAIQGVFGETGLYLKQSIDTICHYIFIDLLGSLVQLATLPLEWMAMRLIRAHVSSKVHLGIEMLGMPIHEDLLYKTTRCAVDIFVPPKRQTC